MTTCDDMRTVLHPCSERFQIRLYRIVVCEPSDTGIVSLLCRMTLPVDYSNDERSWTTHSFFRAMGEVLPLQIAFMILILCHELGRRSRYLLASSKKQP